MCSSYKTHIKNKRSSDEEIIVIHKISDEWFYINYDNIIYYKCDQIEGLSKCS